MAMLKLMPATVAENLLKYMHFTKCAIIKR